MSINRVIKSILLVLLLSVLMLPFIQGITGWVDDKKYFVSVTHDNHMDFSLKDWFNGRYQLNSDRYFKENYGFRGVFVRLYNQIDYSLFKEANAAGVVIGQEGYLYEKNYIDSYYGNNYIGKDSIHEIIQKLKFLQDTFKSMNKTLLCVIAPGKGYYFPRYIPEKLQCERKTTNYDVYKKTLVDNGINLIDFNALFLEQKDVSEYPLYGKNGIHWSYYGLCLAADSLINKMEDVSGYTIGNAYWDTLVVDNERPYDKDIVDGLNILFPPKGDSMAYPAIEFREGDTFYKPNVITIADSYYYGMFNFNIGQAFGRHKYWYYNIQVIPDSYSKSLFTKELNLEEEIEQTDVIMILCTEGNLTDFSWGFVDRAFSTYKN